VEFRSAGEVTAAGLRASRQAKAPTPVAREEQLPDGADEITDELSKLWLTDEDR
jgi:hypothetical protein